MCCPSPELESQPSSSGIFTVIADPSNAISETGESNNSGSARFSLETPRIGRSGLAFVPALLAAAGINLVGWRCATGFAGQDELGWSWSYWKVGVPKRWLVAVRHRLGCLLQLERVT